MRTKLVMAAALSLAFAALGPASIPTFAQQATAPSKLLHVDSENMGNVSGDSAMLVLVTTKGCTPCDAWQAGFEKANPSAMKLGVAFAEELGVPAQALPMVIEVVPGAYVMPKGNQPVPTD